MLIALTMLVPEGGFVNYRLLAGPQQRDPFPRVTRQLPIRLVTKHLVCIHPFEKPAAGALRLGGIRLVVLGEGSPLDGWERRLTAAIE